jgi:hypothetical protein
VAAGADGSGVGRVCDVQVSNRPVLEQKAQVNVWQQIGAPEPGAAAQQLMKQNDNFGYKSRTQMLAQGSPQVNVWQQIGAPEPKVAAAQLMKQNDNFGYKAPTQKLFMVRNKKNAKVSPLLSALPLPGAPAHSPTCLAVSSGVWHMYPPPLKAYARAGQMARPNVWKSIGAPTPEDAAKALFKQVMI